MRAVETDGTQRLNALVDHAPARGIDARGLLREELPDDEILDAAAKEKPDLIIMGTHGRRGASRLLMGRIAFRLVSRAPCPVMTVRPADAESPAAQGRRREGEAK
jgi:nucleotide-binding universal stress UspA family protein